MGLGFVLLIWTMLFGCAGLPVAAALGYWSWRRGRAAGNPSRFRALAAAVLPFVLVATGLAWFFLYAEYSWTVRHVDPGLGDSWAVPLRHGYFFCMIDVTDHGYLMKDGCSGVPPVHDVVELAESADAIVGVSSSSGAFVFDMASDTLTPQPDRARALAQFSPPPQLESAAEFYGHRRFGWQDVAALAILIGVLASISWAWWCFIWRRPTRA